MTIILNSSDISGNYKSLWQKDISENKHKQLSLRSLLYTTLPNKKFLRSKKTRKTIITTEPITIKNRERQDKINRITEKYLSFDELMHLRKYNSTAFAGRRHNEDGASTNKEEKSILREEETTTVSTSEYTANTPFIRLKHCTRKLTCTWTAASLTDSAGSLLPGGHGSNFGSNTPPGYVEGCTRTSTCTRDFMNRNKMDTMPTEATLATEADNDEDYCERRSLNKRNVKTNNTLHKHKKSKKFPKLKSVLKYRLFTEKRNKNKRYLNNKYNTLVESRKKKNIIYENINDKRSNDIILLSYGDLFYLVLQKLLDTWKYKSNRTHTKCLCNNVDKLRCSHFILLITVLVIK